MFTEKGLFDNILNLKIKEKEDLAKKVKEQENQIEEIQAYNQSLVKV